MLDRENALNLIKENVKTQSLINHMLATEAIMKKVAEFLGEDKNLWAMAGLLHDIDFEKTKEMPEQHGILACKILDKLVDEKILRAIKAHNFEKTNVKPESKMEIALLSADAITGLIIAAALVKPEKKLSALTVNSVKNAFKKKGFAAGSNRENIKLIETIGIPLEKFFEISLSAMQEIAAELGL